jgi:hypothetical protein
MFVLVICWVLFATSIELSGLATRVLLTVSSPLLHHTFSRCGAAMNSMPAMQRMGEYLFCFLPLHPLNAAQYKGNVFKVQGD